MSIAITEAHLELEKVARSFLAAHKARAAARSLLDATEERLPPFWSDLAELGWLGLHVAEAYGGSGFGLEELVVVVEALGAAVAPGPFLPTVIASALIADVGSDAQRTRFLPGLTDGSSRAALGLDGSLRLADDGSLSGDGGVVLGGGLADLLVVAAGHDMVIVERSQPGVAVSIPPNLDPTRRSGSVRIGTTRVDEIAVLRGARPRALALARTLSAAEACGGAHECVEHGERLRQGARAVRPDDRHVPGGQAPLRQHAGGGRAGHRRRVGRRPRARTRPRPSSSCAAAVAAAVGLPAFLHNAQITSRSTAASASPGSTTPTSTCAGPPSLVALLGRPARPRTSTRLTRRRESTGHQAVDLPPGGGEPSGPRCGPSPASIRPRSTRGRAASARLIDAGLRRARTGPSRGAARPARSSSS